MILIAIAACSLSALLGLGLIVWATGWLYGPRDDEVPTVPRSVRWGDQKRVRSPDAVRDTDPGSPPPVVLDTTLPSQPWGSLWPARTRGSNQ